MPSIASIVSTKILRMGMAGPDVKQVQIALALLGYPLHGTGYFGIATDTAVHTFQRQAGLDADGEVETSTAKAIDAALAAPKPATGVLAPAASASPAAGRPLWLEAGLGLLGTREVPGSGDNPAILAWAKQEGGDIAKEYTHDSIAWCALGVGHCLTLAGLKGTGTLWALDYAHYGVPLLGPAVGAIAPMKRTGGGHVTIVAGKDQHGNLMCLGFNQGDTVSIIPFPATRPVAFRWPKDVPLPSKTGMASLPVISSNGKVSSKES
jgi:uncharacterized protein (TIGR02594 family)